MRFSPVAHDVPPELIAAHEKGRTIFVCCAGVSRCVGLPLFSGLVEGVYEYLGEDWRLHPAEREGMRNGGALHRARLRWIDSEFLPPPTEITVSFDGRSITYGFGELI
jgi:hypothetical protein